jgi:hypothetical protein
MNPTGPFLRRGRSKRLRGLAVVLAVIGMTAACASPRATLGPDESPCFQALPIATAAVGRQGRLAGVDRVAVNELARVEQRLLPRPTTTATTPAPTVAPRSSRRFAASKPALCLVAFRGKFDPAKFTPGLLRGPLKGGKYAVVAVGVRSHRARAVYFIDALPRRFRHL